jgi:hypothetical protein
MARRDPLEPVQELPGVLAGRPRPRPKRNRDWDRKRSKVTYDLPAGLIERIREIAKELAEAHPGATVRVADVARLLLEAGLERYEAGELQVELRPRVFGLYPD